MQYTMKKIVVLETNMGQIEIELDHENAQITTENFIRYVQEGYYDGTIFHRIIDGFMIQGGGYTPDGEEKPTRKAIKLKSNNGLKNQIGTIAMARTSDPNSATSQFFINVADNHYLNYAKGNDGYAVFGRVISGMETVNRIKTVKTGNKGSYTDWPQEDVIIEHASLTKPKTP
ncbi:MAG: Cyclophilin type peptidyl-prolyl cis-trans isomerase/CLD [Candidatus Argoarchaeum ethanivorans]|uniref:peptidylprolyl isomerase n=1 Tax=Candidatus Argoarchaeum ethanivorans TaxID=2608793 RepID=A0A812A110_9EURY|nr:MAG: Cyclophilin type peptidyl-prolyl cis-trans isomerase/CLD [Candidatus Argoarchaeum ethanivorans]